MRKDRYEGREAEARVSSFILHAGSITAVAVDISCVYSLYTLMKVRLQPAQHMHAHAHTHSISSLNGVFLLCMSQRMFVYVLYTVGAVI